MQSGAMVKARIKARETRAGMRAKAGGRKDPLEGAAKYPLGGAGKTPLGGRRVSPITSYMNEVSLRSKRTSVLAHAKISLRDKGYTHLAKQRDALASMM
jgi:hypothetical protein